MKILHFSNEGLPDTRIDRYASLFKDNKDTKVFFCGGLPKYANYKNIFYDQIINLPATPKHQLEVPFFYRAYKNAFKRIFLEINPNVVHAHNFFSAKVCFDLHIPYIYDDHEYWKLQVKARTKEKNSKFSKRMLTNFRFNRLISKNEKKIIENASAVITVSDTIADEHKAYNENTYTISNFPASYEDILIPSARSNLNKLKVLLITNYSSTTERISADKYIKSLSLHDTDLTVIGKVPPKFQNVTYLGYIPHIDLIKIIPNYHIGLQTFHGDKKEVGYFKYSSPNRVFLYLHAGLIPVIHEEMTYLRKILNDFSIVVNDETQLAEIIPKFANNDDFIQNSPRKTQVFARQYLMFDSYFPLISDIYQKFTNQISENNPFKT